MAAVAHLDGLRPLPQQELASLLRQRRARALSARRNEGSEHDDTVAHKSQSPPETWKAPTSTPKSSDARVHHLDLKENTERDLYTRPKPKQQPSAESLLLRELHNLELWLPEVRTHMRDEVHFVRRSWFLKKRHIAGSAIGAGAAVFLVAL